MSDTAPQVEYAANWYRTRLHYSINLMETTRGRRGKALCSSPANTVEVMDQDEHNSWEQYFHKRDAPPICELPLCKRCERKAAQRGV
ncbi:hypothetical protein ABT341_00370 [Pseudonocardia alni]|uniref:hypothetical protein n=1 Tax=Pseudonocardia alni TaxID=33907 RepID=UPI00331F191F